MLDAVREVDASHGEGGGQLLRTAVALAALTHTPLHLTHVRARRAKPGLAPQHLTAVRAVAALCAGRAEGLTLGSEELVFHPGELRGGAFAFDVGTAGSVPLVLQALLPAMVASGQRFEVRLTGGTDIRAAPPLDYVDHVLLPLLRRLGARVTLQCARRGYYPRGGGVVEVSVEPCTLTGRRFETPGRVLAVRGIAHASHLPVHVPERMRASALACLAQRSAADIEIRALAGTEAIGVGGAIVIWAEAEHTVLGSGRVAQRGVPAEILGSEAGSELAGDLDAGATLDVHAADQLLVYLALSDGGAFLTRAISSHAETTMWLIEQLLPVRFVCSARGLLTHVAIVAQRDVDAGHARAARPGFYELS